MPKFELNLIIQYYEVIMPRNIFLDHSPLFVLTWDSLSIILCLHSSTKCGVAERKNCHLVETARTLLVNHKVP